MLLTLEWWPERGRNRTGARTVPKPELTDEQWSLINDLFPEGPAFGIPRIPPLPCLEGILWMLRAGYRWQDLPERFPSYPTCWRRLNELVEAGVFQKVWARLLKKLDRLGEIDWEEAMAHATFSPVKKGGFCVGRTKKGKGTTLLLLIDGQGLPMGMNVASASPSD